MIILIILGMAIVTLLPRIIPVFLINKLMFKPWVNRMLQAIPFAALGALIFPGILTVIEGKPHIGIAGGIVAVVLAALRLNIIIAVVGAIATVYVMTM